MNEMPGLHANIFIAMQETHKGFQGTSECELLILNKFPLTIVLKIKFQTLVETSLFL